MSISKGYSDYNWIRSSRLNYTSKRYAEDHTLRSPCVPPLGACGAESQSDEAKQKGGTLLQREKARDVGFFQKLNSGGVSRRDWQARSGNVASTYVNEA